jgi:hypothetical protein
MFGPIAWGPLGSRGDLVPPRALAKHLAKMGLDVTYIPLCTEDEGLELLKNLEGGNTLRGTKVYLRAHATLTSCPGTTIGISEMPGADVRYSLQPPRTVIRMARFNLGHVGDVVLNALVGSRTADFRIGAYLGSNWVPRSADGTTFLESRPNNGLYPAGMVWGSSHLPRPILPGVRDIPGGDHQEIFRDYKVVHCHGGAGTVQTAGASGCRVVTHSSVLDRDYRMPHDAALGIGLGASPDRILLALGAKNPLAYVAYARRGWMAALEAATWALMAHGADLAWGLVVLVSLVNTARQSVTIGPTFLATMATALVGPLLGTSWLAHMATPVVGQIFDVSLDAGGVDRLELARTVAGAILRTLTSGVGLAVTLELGLGWGVVAIYAFETISPALKAVYALLIGVMAVPAMRDEDDHAIVRFNMSLAGITPVVHVGLVNKAKTGVYELRFAGPHGFFGDEAMIGLYPYRNVTGFVFETQSMLPWSEVQRLPNVRGSYSLFFNCQVTLVSVLGPSISLLGIGGFGLWLGSIMAASTVALGLTLFAFPLLVACLIPDLLGIMDPLGLGPNWGGFIRKLETLFRRALESKVPFVRRMMRVVNGPMAGFSDSPTGTILMMEEIGRLQRLAVSDAGKGMARAWLALRLWVDAGLIGAGRAAVSFVDWVAWIASRASPAIEGLAHTVVGRVGHRPNAIAPRPNPSNVPEFTLALNQRFGTIFEKGRQLPAWTDGLPAGTRVIVGLDTLGEAMQFSGRDAFTFDDPLEMERELASKLSPELHMQIHQCAAGIHPGGTAVKAVFDKWKDYNIDPDDLTPSEEGTLPVDASVLLTVDRQRAMALVAPDWIEYGEIQFDRWERSPNVLVLGSDESRSIAQIVKAAIEYGADATDTVRLILRNTTSPRVMVIGLDLYMLLLTRDQPERFARLLEAIGLTEEGLDLQIGAAMTFLDVEEVGHLKWAPGLPWSDVSSEASRGVGTTFGLFADDDGVGMVGPYGPEEAVTDYWYAMDHKSFMANLAGDDNLDDGRYRAFGDSVVLGTDSAIEAEPRDLALPVELSRQWDAIQTARVERAAAEKDAAEQAQGDFSDWD